MPNLRQSLYIADSFQQIERKINSALAKKANDYFPTVLGKIHNDIIRELPNLMRSNPIYDYIEADLGAELGFYAGTGRQHLDEIMDEFVNGLEVTYTPIKFYRLFRGGINVTVFKYDFERLLELPAAQIEDNERGYKLDWLEWLLFEGDRIVIAGHSRIWKISERSRSGYALMSRRGKGNWRVPPRWSGTEKNNFITRHIQSQLSVIQNLVQTVLRKYTV